MNSSIPSATQARHEWMCRELRKSIATQVSAIRTSREITQAKLAKLSSLCVQVIIEVEKPCGKWPTVKTLLKIAQGLDCALMVKFEAYSKFLQEIEQWLPPQSLIEESAGD